MNVISPKTRMMRLPYGEEIVIVGRTMWTQSTSVTDRQTDKITITNTVQRRASHGKNREISQQCWWNLNIGGSHILRNMLYVGLLFVFAVCSSSVDLNAIKMSELNETNSQVVTKNNLNQSDGQDNPPSTHTTPWPHFIIDVGLVQRGYSIPSPVLLKCCVASVVA